MATITQVGSLNQNGGPYTITLTQNVPAGSGILILVWLAGSSAQTWGASDTQGNTYQVDVQEIDFSNELALGFISAYVSTALVAGVDTITFTTTQSSEQYILTVFCLSSILSSNWFDQSVQGEGGGSNVTSTLTPGTSPTFAIAVFAWGGTLNSYCNIMGSAATGLDNISGFGFERASEWRELTSTTAGTASINISNSFPTYIFATYKEGSTGQQGSAGSISSEFHWLGGDDN
jgi:hypothetical protein